LHRYSTELHKSGLAVRTRSRALSYARDLIKWAAAAGIYQDNFALALKMPRIPKTIPKVPTAAEIETMLDGGCPTSWPNRDRCAVELLYCDLRVCELVAIDLRDRMSADQLL
jgi:integrase/recombinase XerC